jgi:hypothetical protein
MDKDIHPADNERTRTRLVHRPVRNRQSTVFLSTTMSLEKSTNSLLVDSL